MQQADEFVEVREMPEVPHVAIYEDEPQMFQEVKSHQIIRKFSFINRRL